MALVAVQAQRVADGGGGCHLDLHVDGSLSVAADDAVALGASVRHAQDGLIIARSRRPHEKSLRP